MKKVVAFIFVILMLVGLMLVKVDNLAQLDYEKLIIVSACQLENAGREVKNGNDFYYTLDKTDFVKFNLSQNKIKGLVYYINKKYDLSYFNKKFNYCIYRGGDVDGREIYYGYDKSYYDFRFVEGKKVNFQLVDDKDYWILGYPMIMTGF